MVDSNFGQCQSIVYISEELSIALNGFGQLFNLASTKEDF